jgi:epoxyqueuosine reductase
LIHDLRSAAAEEGFTLFGVAPAVTATGFADLVRWIDLGYCGQMDYFARRLDAYREPSSVLAGARSIVMLALPYDAAPCSQPGQPGRGKLARYVWQRTDYHDRIHDKLKRLCQLITRSTAQAKARGVVDTAPLLEREFAQLAGLGWRGKNTLLLNKRDGSYFFLAALLTNIELTFDTPQESSHCGTCTACLDACPTDAFPSAGVLDASRCISYLTIEHRGPIPRTIRQGIGDWLFGCDVCQEVCPWNRKRSRASQRPDDALDCLDLHELFTIDDDQFRQRFRKTPLWRARRRGILRNAAIVLGNRRDATAIDALEIGLNDAEPIIRGASAWALGQIGGVQAVKRLNQRLPSETDPEVREEIESALAAEA